MYQKAKDHILENWQTLCYYDPDLPVSLETNASQSGLGVVLLQEGRPISFMSKALTDTQSRYSNIEMEILGVVTGVEHFHQYLFGRQFTLYTYHKPIESLVLKPGADIGEIDSHSHLIVIDYYSFTVFEWPLPSLATSSVITAFKTIFSDTGTPLTLVMDNALCFTSEEFSDFAKSWNFNHITSISKVPQRQCTCRTSCWHGETNLQSL